MAFNKKIKSMSKRFNYKVIAVALIMSLSFTFLAVNGGFNFQSQFLVNDDAAIFRLAGLSYEGNKYVSESSFKNANPGAEVFIWRDNKISFDIDGPITFDTSIDGIVFPPRQLENFGGLKPDMTFEITQNPVLVDMDGNPMPGGYTDKLTRADGATQYMYWYKSSISISNYMGIINMQTLRDLEVIPPGGNWFDLWYDGLERPLAAMAEMGIIRNINSLIEVDLPEVEGYTLGWEMHIDATNAEMTFSLDGTVYNEYNYQPVFDEHPEGSVSIWDGDGQFHFNKNDNIQRTNSVGEKLVPVEVGEEEVVSVGLTQALVPGIVRTETVIWGIFVLDSVSNFYYFTPKIVYDVIIKVAVVDDIIDPDPTNTTITPPTTPPPFTWGDLNIGMEPMQAVMLGGGIFFGVIIIGMLASKKRESMY